MPGLNPYFEAFRALTTDRPVGMGAGPIPWTSIDRYARRYGFNGDEFEELEHHIRALDSAYMEHQQSEKPSGNANDRRNDQNQR